MIRKSLKYAPFVKVGQNWVRAGYMHEGVWYEYSAGSKAWAVSRYQNWLLLASMGHVAEQRRLRPVK